MTGTRLSYVQEATRSDPKRRRAEFSCDCGSRITTDLHWVRFLNVTSCGCFKSEVVIKKNLKHGHAARDGMTGCYRSWAAMHQRVQVNPLYADRPVCDRWSGPEGFANFYADMGDRPAGMSIERINNSGPYAPKNCKWASSSEQNLNKSNSRKNRQ